MTLMERISDDMKGAMRSRDALKLGALRMAKAALMNREVERAVDDAVRETGATSPKDMGRVMKAAMAKFAAGQVDGKVISELVKRKLAGG